MRVARPTAEQPKKWELKSAAATKDYRYTFLEELNYGGTATVYKAVDTQVRSRLSLAAARARVQRVLLAHNRTRRRHADGAARRHQGV